MSDKCPDIGIDKALLSAYIKTAQGGMTYRQVAEQAYCAAATVMRAVKMQPIDMTRLLRLCKWMKVPHTRFLKEIPPEPKGNPKSETPKKIAALLLEDGILTANQIDGICAFLSAAYRTEKSSPPKNQGEELKEKDV